MNFIARLAAFQLKYGRRKADTSASPVPVETELFCTLNLCSCTPHKVPTNDASECVTGEQDRAREDNRTTSLFSKRGDQGTSDHVIVVTFVVTPFPPPFFTSPTGLLTCSQRILNTKPQPQPQTGWCDVKAYISEEEYSGALILVPSLSLQQNSSSIWRPG